MAIRAAAEGATPGTAQAKGLRESTKILESDGAILHPSTEGARCPSQATEDGNLSGTRDRGVKRNVSPFFYYAKTEFQCRLT